MDLAKIRKKSRQPLAVDLVNSIVHIKPDTQTAGTDKQTAIVAAASPKIDFPNNVVTIRDVETSCVPLIPRRAGTYWDPIEIILAGRNAAGCYEEKTVNEELHVGMSENCLLYLCFRVSDEIYAINIMDIKEITKPREVTEIPRAPKFVSGILSLRGTIIPIIDMRSRLGLSCENATGKERIVVIKKDPFFSGLLVDEVIQVVRINNENIEPPPSVLEGIDRDFVSGIGRSDGRFIIILNLENIADIHLC